MIDLHCHLLPGIDDGPETLDEALGMARLAVEDGIREAFVTPHIHVGRWDNEQAGIAAAVSAYQAELGRQRIPLKVGFAAEVRLDYDVMALIEQERVPFFGTLEGFKVMLLELPHDRVPVGSDKFVAWLLGRGIRPMIAHPERNKDIMRDASKLAPFVEAGCLVQVTADALAGEFGPGCEARALQFLELGWVSVMASDAHDIVSRPPRMSAGRAVAAKVVGADAARKLVEDMPRRIVHGR